MTGASDVPDGSEGAAVGPTYNLKPAERDRLVQDYHTRIHLMRRKLGKGQLDGIPKEGTLTPDDEEYDGSQRW